MSAFICIYPAAAAVRKDLLVDSRLAAIMYNNHLLLHEFAQRHAHIIRCNAEAEKKYGRENRKRAPARTPSCTIELIVQKIQRVPHIFQYKYNNNI